MDYSTFGVQNSFFLATRDAFLNLSMLGISVENNPVAPLNSVDRAVYGMQKQYVCCMPSLGTEARNSQRA